MNRKSRKATSERCVWDAERWPDRGSKDNDCHCWKCDRARRPRYPESAPYPEFAYLDPRLVCVLVQDTTWLKVWRTLPPVDVSDDKSAEQLMESAVEWLPRAAETIRQILRARFPARRGRPRSHGSGWNSWETRCYELALIDIAAGKRPCWDRIRNDTAVRAGLIQLRNGKRVEKPHLWYTLKAKVKARLKREGRWLRVFNQS